MTDPPLLDSCLLDQLVCAVAAGCYALSGVFVLLAPKPTHGERLTPVTPRYPRGKESAERALASSIT